MQLSDHATAVPPQCHSEGGTMSDEQQRGEEGMEEQLREHGHGKNERARQTLQEGETITVTMNMLDGVRRPLPLGLELDHNTMELLDCEEGSAAERNDDVWAGLENSLGEQFRRGFIREFIRKSSRSAIRGEKFRNCVTF